ncbi:unnamed protein product, partial [Hapterophycus canaliculatus]
MLKNANGPGSTTFHPTKWGTRHNDTPDAVFVDSPNGPQFGKSLRITFGGTPQIYTTSSTTYSIPGGSPFFGLNGRRVVEIEVFRVCATEATVASPSPPKIDNSKMSILQPGLIDLPVSDTTAMAAESYNDDIRSFGVSIADSLMEEGIALHQAHVELVQANAEAAASVKALVALNGQDVAANKEGANTVVELSVHGTRMTTLRSTLQACPDSAFAVRFDEDKWPPTDKDVDEHGRRVIDDCSPSVFSKILDVLRVRKRKAWASDDGRGGNDARVVVKAADRAAFEEFVDKSFTHHVSFIMDLV